MSRRFASPPNASNEELKRARDVAEELFKEQRRNEGPRAFEAVCAEVEREVRRAMEVTGDLLELTGDTLRSLGASR